MKTKNYVECVEACSKEHPGFHPIKQQRCITECLEVPVSTGMIPFIPVPERSYVITDQPAPPVVKKIVEKVEDFAEGRDLQDVLTKTLITAGVVGAGLVILNAVSKGVGRGFGEGITKKIGGD